MSEFMIRKGESVSFTLTYGTYGDYREHFPQEPVDVDRLTCKRAASGRNGPPNVPIRVDITNWSSVL